MLSLNNENETWEEYTLVDVYVVQLEKILKLVFLCLETAWHDIPCLQFSCRQTEGRGTNWAIVAVFELHGQVSIDLGLPSKDSLGITVLCIVALCMLMHAHTCARAPTCTHARTNTNSNRTCLQNPYFSLQNTNWEMLD
jgi:hypothetical protein